jgi:hypothetical protein
MAPTLAKIAADGAAMEQQAATPTRQPAPEPRKAVAVPRPKTWTPQVKPTAKRKGWL